MKTPFLSILLCFSFLFSSNICLTQSVGINASGVAPDKSAILDLNSSDKGFLITRVDTSSILLPAFGLMTLAPIDTCLYLFNGVSWIGMGGGGSNCTCNCSNAISPPVFPCNGTVIPVVEVINPTTGKTWMDRNLGASQIATNSTDAAAYGDLYQWGRCSDGHEKRISGVITTLSTTDDPGHGDFIAGSYDWRTPQNTNLWQSVSGSNNPCPTGYRVPTMTELENERLSWSSNDLQGAFASPLKLAAGGYRDDGSGTLYFEGGSGNYWSSTIDGLNSHALLISNFTSSIGSYYRAYGRSIRCIKD